MLSILSVETSGTVIKLRAGEILAIVFCVIVIFMGALTIIIAIIVKKRSRVPSKKMSLKRFWFNCYNTTTS